jgi:hypothetical protein
LLNENAVLLPVAPKKNYESNDMNYA